MPNSVKTEKIRKYHMVKKLVSARGDGDFPNHEEAAYTIRDDQNNDVNVKSNFSDAYDRLMFLRKKEFTKLQLQQPLIVAGGREISSYDLVSRVIQESGFLYETTELLHGGCRGIDQLAGRFFGEEFPFIRRTEFKADWKKYGDAAGPIRNQEMIDLAKESNGKLILIWDGKSSGSADIKKKAQKANIEIYEQIV